MFLLTATGLENSNEPMTREEFEDPYNKKVQLILYVYSIEPPFYNDVSSACRTLDTTKIKSLGPFARAIFGVLYWGNWSEPKREDALK